MNTNQNNVIVLSRINGTNNAKLYLLSTNLTYIKNATYSSYDFMNHKSISLSKNGIIETKLMHRLVAEAFITNPENKEQVNHIDCNKSNNDINNLEWNTPEENIKHAVNNDRQRDQNGENNNMSKLTQEDVNFIRDKVKEGMTTYKIHKEFYPYLHQQTIYAITSNRLWKS